MKLLLLTELIPKSSHDNALLKIYDQYEMLRRGNARPV